MFRTLSVTAACVFLALPAVAQDNTRKLHHVTGDVYLFQNNFHMSLVVPTSEGTVRVDPINADAGAWLNENLKEITDQPVTHLIYSHSHGDHASGGSAHPDAEVIAHEAAGFTLHGTTPTVRIGDTHTMTVGSKTFELTNVGAGHDNHMLVTVVRPENVGFIVDIAAPKRLPFRNFGGANVDQWMGQIKAAMEIDFDIFAPGHGVVGKKSDLGDALGYMEKLRAEVLAGLKAGKSVDDLKADVTMAEYSDWIQYENWREMNVEGMVTYLTNAGLVK